MIHRLQRHKLILDLCSGSGSWSKPYLDAGYDVRRVTLPDSDVRTWQGYLGLSVHGILAAPPCQVFSNARNKNPPSEAQILDALSVVDACLRIIMTCHPVWWALENPVGKLRRWLGPPMFKFSPWHFGDPYFKNTLLWGNFTPPFDSQVVPVGYRRGQPCAWYSSAPGDSASKSEFRAITPPGFARAFFKANP